MRLYGIMRQAAGLQRFAAILTACFVALVAMATVPLPALAAGPTISTIVPDSGSTAGGEPVTITGTGLTGTTAVTIGGVAATDVTVVDDTTVTATTPATVAGALDVTISSAGGSDTLPDGFTANPMVTLPMMSGGVSPASGPTTGGTTVIIPGYGFSAATGVTFDSTAASFTIVNDQEIRATSPAHAAGLVRITIASALSDTSQDDAFEFISNDAALTMLTFSGGVFNETFSPGTAAYTATVANSVSSITVTPTLSDAGATVTVNGSSATSGSASGQISLGVGTNTITVEVTAPYGNTRSWTITITREAPLAAPVAGDVSVSVMAGSTGNAIPLALSGGAAATVTVASPAANGTATESGTAITYTPNAGYSGADSFTYTATNATGTSTPATVSITVNAPPAPVLTISPASGALAEGKVDTDYTGTTIAVSGGIAPYRYALGSGSLPPGLVLDSATGALTGKPTTAGNYSFTITATDSASPALGGSASYTLAVTDKVPVAGDVSVTVAANSTGNAIGLAITGRATSVAVTSGPSNGSVSISGTAVTYTPATDYSGPDSFTYTATNASGTSAAATVSITVTPRQTAVLVFSPAGGTLPQGAINTRYEGPAVTVSGGTAPYTYALAGSLPPGMTLDSSTGAITGTPTATGDYGFTVTVSDSAVPPNRGSVSYTISIATTPAVPLTFSPAGGALAEAMAGENYSQAISVAGASVPPVYSLASGTLPPGMVLNISTGELTGPLAADAQGEYSFSIRATAAGHAPVVASYTLRVRERAVTVTDKVQTVAPGSSPRDVYLNGGATGGPFVSAEATFVDPPAAGTAQIIRGQLAQAAPATAPSGWYLRFTPDPAYSGQVRVGFRLTSDLGISNTGTVTYNIGYDAAKVTSEIDGMVHGFVRTRQNLIASGIHIPGLQERRRMAIGNDPVTARMMPSSRGMTLGVSTSLAQLEAARNKADGVAAGLYTSPFNVWIDGTFMLHNRGQNDGRWGSFGMISAGADYLLSDRALLGLSFHLDRMTDPTSADAELTGNGWLAGPYASFEIGKGVFWDTSLLYGGSANDIDTAFWDGSFDTTRWMFDTSIKGQVNLDQVTVLTPKLRAVYFSETVDDYSVRNGAGDTIGIDGFTAEQLRVSLGAEIARRFTLENGSLLVPKLALTGGFSGLDGSGAFGSLSAGLSLETENDWSLDFSLLFNVDGHGEKSAAARTGVSKRF